MRERSTPRPPKVDPASLEKAAVRHLQRYVATAEQLRRVLRRRLDRAVRRGDPEDLPDDCFGQECEEDFLPCETVADCPEPLGTWACIAGCCAPTPP